MASYAIVETGGKQLRVEPGRFYDVERIAAEPEEQITLDRVLFVQDDGEVSIGQPFVDGAAISATVLKHLRGRKVIVYKMRPKKKTRKKQGHRQELTRLMIDTINLNGATIGASQTKTVLEDESDLDVDVTATEVVAAEVSTEDGIEIPVLEQAETPVEVEAVEVEAVIEEPAIEIEVESADEDVEAAIEEPETAAEADSVEQETEIAVEADSADEDVEAEIEEPETAAEADSVEQETEIAVEADSDEEETPVVAAEDVAAE
jgi:large subunit ribosomal protein L21